MAVRYRFAKDYDHPVSPSADKAYKAGQELVIPEAHAAAADQAKAGARVPAEKPKERDADRG